MCAHKILLQNINICHIYQTPAEYIYLKKYIDEFNSLYNSSYLTKNLRLSLCQNKTVSLFLNKNHQELDIITIISPSELRNGDFLKTNFETFDLERKKILLKIYLTIKFVRTKQIFSLVFKKYGLILRVKLKLANLSHYKLYAISFNYVL